MPTSREPDKQQNSIKQLKRNELDLNAAHIELKIAWCFARVRFHFCKIFKYVHIHIYIYICRIKTWAGNTHDILDFALPRQEEGKGGEGIQTGLEIHP